MRVKATGNPMIISRWAKRALKARLFVPYWSGEQILSDPSSIHYMSFIPDVGWAIAYRWSYSSNHLAVFVKEELRRTGQGRALVVALRKGYTGSKLGYGYGKPGSKEFFKSVLEVPIMRCMRDLTLV